MRDQGYFYEDGERISFDEPIGDEYCEFSEDGSGNFLGINCDWNLSGNRLAISVYGEKYDIYRYFFDGCRINY